MFAAAEVCEGLAVGVIVEVCELCGGTDRLRYQFSPKQIHRRRIHYEELPRHRRLPIIVPRELPNEPDRWWGMYQSRQEICPPDEGIIKDTKPEVSEGKDSTI